MMAPIASGGWNRDQCGSQEKYGQDKSVMHGGFPGGVTHFAPWQRAHEPCMNRSFNRARLLWHGLLRSDMEERQRAVRNHCGRQVPVPLFRRHKTGKTRIIAQCVATGP